MNLSDSEKLILVMLSDIHEKLAIKDSVDPKFVREAVYSGNAWGLKWRHPGIFDNHETSDAVRTDVLNTLDLWSFLERGYKNLSPAEKKRVETEAAPLGKTVRFRGFDGNNEGEYINAAHFLIDFLDRFPDFKGRDLNSHMPSIDAYRRMHVVFEPMLQSLAGRELSVTEIIEILKAQIHPSNR